MKIKKQIALWQYDGARFPVVLTGRWEMFGRTDYRISPLGGDGEFRVQESKLFFQESVEKKRIPLMV